MPLQSLSLVMAGLGIAEEKNDANARLTPPPLTPGVHLRWAFPPGKAFPWGGFYLFRRLHGDATRPLVVKPVEPPGTSLNADNSIWWAPNPPLRAVLVRSSLNLFVDATGDVTYPAGYRLTGARAFGFHLFPRANPAHKVTVKMLVPDERVVEVVAYCGNEAVVAAGAYRNGALAEAVLEFDAITGVEIRPVGAATLPHGWVVEVSFYEVLDAVKAPSTSSNWEALTADPIRLPITHPAYPCTRGKAEDMEAERARTRSTVKYGAADDVFRPPVVLEAGGQVRLSHGSPLVLGVGTAWTDSLGGAVLCVDKEQSCYGVAQVLRPDKLLLSRPYEGGAAAAPQDYRIVEDAFAQLYDQCAGLVRGGPAGEPMSLRINPSPVPSVGTLNLSAGGDLVTGVGTTWGAELEDLELLLVGADEGTISLKHGSNEVRGDAPAQAAWTKANLVGMVLRFDGRPSSYTVTSVNPAGQLRLNRNYEGPDLSNALYAITEPSVYRVLKVEGPTTLKLDRPYAGRTTSGQRYRLLVRMTSSEEQPDKTPPFLPQHKPLDLVLLQAMHPALAQALGLYWVDRPPAAATGYDYLLVADYPGRFNTASEALGAFGDDPAALDGYVVFNKGIDVPVTYRPAGSPPVTYIPLSPPGNVRAYDLPGASANPQRPDVVRDASAGIVWELSEAGVGPLLPDRALMYHLWRAELGDGDLPDTAAPVPDAKYKLLTSGQPLMVAPTTLPGGLTPPTPPRWPKVRMHATDRALDDGWYSYQVHGIDVFGRHSAVSAPARWMQWTPTPRPRPWYYDDLVGDGQVAQPAAAYAIRLLDRVGPPPPGGVEAFALDLSDPTLLKDAAFQRWLSSLSEEERTSGEVGLRVRWTWATGHMKQAPDTKEFRLYFHPGQLNSQRGRVTKAVPGGGESEVETDVAIPGTSPADAYVGATLYCGGLPYRVTASKAGTPLRARVRNFGTSYNTGGLFVQPGSAVVKGTPDTRWTPAMTGSRLRIFNGAEVTEYTLLQVRANDELLLSKKFYGTPAVGALAYLIYEAAPAEGVACTLSLGGEFADGRVAVVYQDRTVKGDKTAWGPQLLGSLVRVGDEPTLYRVLAVDVARQELQLERPYEGATDVSASYAILNPAFIDYTAPANWQERLCAVDYDDRDAYRLDEKGNRVYEIFLPRAGAPARRWLPLRPSVEDLIAYGNVAVSADDDKRHAPDDARWDASAWGKRVGNEGRVSTPAKVFCVYRTPPPPPLIPPVSASVYATPPDYHNHSFYTFRWYPRPHLSAHVLRAMDATLFQVDWSRRAKSRTPIYVGDPVFPPEYQGDDPSKQAQRASIALQINQLNDAARFPDSDQGMGAAMSYYRQHLDNDALRVLAGLAGNEAAFAQMTVQPLDKSNAPDRRGPDDPPDYAPRPELLCAYTDTLEGGSRNRFFYRALFVDGANNRGGLSVPGPPVYLPQTVAPRVPVLTSLLATGEREITVKWASNREPELARYHVFRADFSDDARDTRLMRKLGTLAPSAERPEARPAEESWVDQNLDGGWTYYYRVAAEDSAGNLSEACAAAPARAYELSPPLSPEWEHARWNAEGTGVELSWRQKDTRELETRVLKRSRAGNWYPLTQWLPAGTLSYVDWHSPHAEAAQYRLRVRTAAGNLNRVGPDADRLVEPFSPPA